MRFRVWSLRFLASAGLSGGAGCSALLDLGPEQCDTDLDCIDLGDAFTGLVCGDSNTCVPAPCESNGECSGRLSDDYFCNLRKSECVLLLSEECQNVSGDLAAKDAVVFGSLLPTTGSYSSMGVPIQNGIHLALNDFYQNSNGLPPLTPGSSSRPLAMVECNDAGDSETAIRAAKHLTQDLGLPAIIGPAFSGIAVKVATEVTIPEGALLISPSATSTSLSKLDDSGLVWRTAPPDTLQGLAIAELISTLESTIRSQMSEGEAMRVAIVHKGDAYGTSLADALSTQLVFNGKAALDNGSNFIRIDYGNPDDNESAATNYAGVTAEIAATLPHVIAMLGTSEVVTEVLPSIEGIASEVLPFYIFSDGGKIPELWASVQGNNQNDVLRRRLLGTAPGTTNSRFRAFQMLYESAYGQRPETFGAAGAYDATYLLAYASVTAPSKELTGFSLATQLAQMIPPKDLLPVGPSSINSAFSALKAGKYFDFEGASGPLDFDASTGEAPSDIEVWCIEPDLSGAVSSGVYLDSTSNALVGGISELDAGCAF